MPKIITRDRVILRIAEKGEGGILADETVGEARLKRWAEASSIGQTSEFLCLSGEGIIILQRFQFVQRTESRIGFERRPQRILKNQRLTSNEVDLGMHDLISSCKFATPMTATSAAPLESSTFLEYGFLQPDSRLNPRNPNCIKVACMNLQDFELRSSFKILELSFIRRAKSSTFNQIISRNTSALQLFFQFRKRTHKEHG